jgi:hypothetical protein
MVSTTSNTVPCSQDDSIQLKLNLAYHDPPVCDILGSFSIGVYHNDLRSNEGLKKVATEARPLAPTRLPRLQGPGGIWVKHCRFDAMAE